MSWSRKLKRAAAARKSELEWFQQFDPSIIVGDEQFQVADPASAVVGGDEAFQIPPTESVDRLILTPEDLAVVKDAFFGEPSQPSRPSVGDVAFLCVHRVDHEFVSAPQSHIWWIPEPTTFDRPDGSQITGQWLYVCNKCHVFIAEFGIEVARIAGEHVFSEKDVQEFEIEEVS